MPSGFGTKPTKRKAMCTICSEKMKVYNAKHPDARKISNAKSNAKSNPISNPIWNPINNSINNAKTSATKLANKIEYEQKTIGDKIDISDEARDAAGQQCIITIEERLGVYKLLYSEGFMVAIYGASTGSYTIKHEGRMQFSGRG